MAVSPTQLSGLLAHILSTAQGWLDDAALAQPSHAYVSHTAPALDCCDLLAVFFTDIKPTKSPTIPVVHLNCAATQMVHVTISLTRCVPVGEDVLDSVLQTSAVDLAKDAWVLQTRWMESACSDSGAPALIPTNSGCTVVGQAVLSAIKPLGGCAGNKLVFVVELDPVSD